MNDAVLIALIAAIGALVTAVTVELVRSWRRDRHIKHEIGRVLDEVQPNGGKSLRDSVDRIERTQAKQGERLARVEVSVKYLSDRNRGG